MNPPADSQGLDNVHKQRVAEVLGDPEGSEKRRSRESLTVDTVKYESGPDGGEEVSMGVEWSGVSTARGPVPPQPFCRLLPSAPAQLRFCKSCPLLTWPVPRKGSSSPHDSRWPHFRHLDAD